MWESRVTTQAYGPALSAEDLDSVLSQRWFGLGTPASSGSRMGYFWQPSPVSSWYLELVLRIFTGTGFFLPEKRSQGALPLFSGGDAKSGGD